MSTILSLNRLARRHWQKLDRKRPKADLRVRIGVVLKVTAG